MKSRASFFVLFAVMTLLMASGCATISYKPSVSLPVSSSTIKANVEICSFENKCPASDSNSKVGGVSATAPGTLAGSLSDEVTSAVLTDFNNELVFDTIKRKVDNPDYILKGSINRFYGRAGINALGWVTLPVDIIWFLGVPMQTSEGMVDITMQLYKPDTTLVATYNGKSEYSELYTMYNNPVLSTPSKLNHCFSEVIGQIREQMLKDSDKLSVNRTAPAGSVVPAAAVTAP